MQYKVFNYDRYDVLAGFTVEGNVFITTYVSSCYYLMPNITIEQVCEKGLMAYATFADGSIHGLTLLHASEIVDKHTAIKRLHESLVWEFDGLTWKQCTIPVMEGYVNGMNFIQQIIHS